MFSDSELYDRLVEKSADPALVAALPLDEAAAMCAELIGSAWAPGLYPREADGAIDLYAVAAAVRRQARKLCRED